MVVLHYVFEIEILFSTETINHSILAAMNFLVMTSIIIGLHTKVSKTDYDIHTAIKNIHSIFDKYDYKRYLIIHEKIEHFIYDFSTQMEQDQYDHLTLENDRLKLVSFKINYHELVNSRQDLANNFKLLIFFKAILFVFYFSFVFFELENFPLVNGTLFFGLIFLLFYMFLKLLYIISPSLLRSV